MRLNDLTLRTYISRYLSSSPACRSHSSAARTPDPAPPAKNTIKRNLVLGALALLLCPFLFSHPAQAACTNPSRVEGAMVYNSDYHVMQLCTGTNWLPMGGMGGGGSGLIPIATQTASASTNLQFTNLPTNYNTLFLNCTGLLFSANGNTITMVIGQGAGPTWQTAAHYSIVQIYQGTIGEAVTWTDMLYFNNGSSTTVPTSIKFYIDNIGSSSMYKNATLDAYNDLAPDSSAHTWAFWNNDTNPVTGLKLSISAGTITSGQCSLYGMN